MLALYPSNKLEHLSYLLGALLKQQPGAPLQPETILVESPGMQHWLNMELARQRGVAMNLQFPLPVRFMWNTARSVLGEDKVPRQSVYRREVLVWRIDKIVQSDDFCALAAAEPVCAYWQHLGSETEQGVQRLQFATALADVFEQYQLFRPDWLFSWERGERVFDDHADEAWQAIIWRKLVEVAPLHPARLHEDAVHQLQQEGCEALPERIIVFAINTMAPQLVQFLDALSAHTDIHVFHLNPSVSYWGEAKSDREQARLLRQQGVEQWKDADQNNPLLGNLGQQGRDLFNLLTELDSFEVSAFDTDLPDELAGHPSRLAILQQDILHGINPLLTPHSQDEFDPEDNSIILTKAHSPLREVQGLHDQLLAIMNEDSSIGPSDIVVMCPAIEEYAPMIDAVFHRVGTPTVSAAFSLEEDTHPTPQIPCSIADRSPLDADPLIAAFLSLLNLPDSRFEVTKIMDYLRMEALRKRFGLTADDLDLMTFWLQEAAVHWGLDTQHKSQVAGHAGTPMFSWLWGLERLLVGMAAEDDYVLHEKLLTIPHAEGQATVVLGKLIDLVYQLKHYAQALNTPRTAAQWHSDLMQMRDDCFTPGKDQLDSWESLSAATNELVSQCAEAGYEEALSLRQVRDVLMKRFSSPDAGNHFLTGQVTFCSMLPMRSIPFKVVCILGLNDGEFPRQSQPISIDLMAESGRKIGDRSRRMEDRYLFLEALISARQVLYLSYQANSAQDNSEREPSLVLKELLRLLAAGYAFEDSHTRQLGLHPFSPQSFTGKHAGFEKGWLRLAEVVRSHHSKAPQSKPDPLSDVVLPDYLTAAQLARSFTHPLKYFANSVLGVYLDTAEPQLSDAEPFKENNLVRYQVMQALTKTLIDENAQKQQEQDTQAIITAARMSGKLPDTHLSDALLSRWESATHLLMESAYCPQDDIVQAGWKSAAFTLEVTAYQGRCLKMWHTGSGNNTQRKLEQFITLLVFNAAGYALPLTVYFVKWDKGQPMLRQASYEAVTEGQASELLTRFGEYFAKLGSGPECYFSDVALSLLVKAKDTHLSEWLQEPEARYEWQKVWADNMFSAGLGNDPYVRWFFPEGIEVNELPADVFETLFRPLIAGYKEAKV